MTNNNWPDPARPGVPLNPERDGWHWFVRGDFYSLALWHRGHFTFQDTTAWPEEFSQLDMTYAGPALTPSEVEARVADARRDGLEEAARVAKGFEGNDHLWSQHRWPLDDAWESASQAAGGNHRATPRSFSNVRNPPMPSMASTSSKR